MIYKFKSQADADVIMLNQSLVLTDMYMILMAFPERKLNSMTA